MRRTITALLAAILGAALLPAAVVSAQDATGVVTGTVTAAADGAAIAGVCVDAISFSGEAAVTTHTTDDGTYELTLPEDVYVVAFNACEDPRDGYVGAIHGLEADQDPFIEVRAGTTTADIDARLATAGTIAGRVTEDGSDAALADVCVRAHPVAGYLAASAATAVDGTYRITTAAAGDHQVLFVDCEAPRFHTPEVYADLPLWPLPSDETERTLVSVTAGATAAGIDASLAVGGIIEGMVTLAHTGQAPWFAVVAGWERNDTDDVPTAIAFTGMEALGLASGLSAGPGEPGRYDLSGIPAGDYTLELSPEMFGFTTAEAWQQRWYAGVDERAEARSLELSAWDHLTDIDLELVPSPSIVPLCEGSQASYPDVPETNTHAVAIGCMTDAGVVQGGDDGRYRPTASVRRDQMASFIARLLRNSMDPTELPSDPPDAFPDDDSNVHEPNIDLLAALGIVEGGTDGRYRPSASVGRGQMATYLARAYERVTGATLRTPATSFQDVEGTSHATSIRKISVAAIGTGTSATTYAPNAPVRRDQMGTFLARLHTRVFLDGGLVWLGSDSGSFSVSSADRGGFGTTAPGRPGG